MESLKYLVSPGKMMLDMNKLQSGDLVYQQLLFDLTEYCGTESDFMMSGAKKERHPV